VVAIAPDRAAPAEDAIDGARHTHRQALHAVAERARVIGLDDKVKVILLDAELQNPETVVGGGGKRPADDREDPAGTQAADGIAGAERDMHGVNGAVRRSGAMRDTGVTSRGRLAPGTCAATSPGARSRKRKLQTASHLDSAMIAG
jgi:hypothetical protein